MKKRYITLSMVLLFSVIYGQDKSTEKADKLFESYQYAGAINEYLKLAQSKKANEYIYSQLGESYYAVNDVDNASKWYAKAATGKVAPEVHYHYAQTLKSRGKYKEANKQMDIFASMAPDDSRAKDYKANPNYVQTLTDKAKLFDIAETNLKHNSEQSDFGSFLTNDNILYFVSTKGSGKTDKWSNLSYLDIFQATRNPDGSLSEPTAVSELNTPFHDGPVTLSSDGKTIYFARDSHSEGQYEKISNNKVKLGQQGLYKATKVDGKWAQIEALPFNSTNYSVTHPSLSSDGKTLYFSSDMPGGLGQTDIWKVTVEAGGYGKPQNLGEAVNTPGKENFPFIDSDNMLYFASSGKQGLGGLDIFKINTTTTEPAQNLGKPVNSEKDDFSFAYNKSLETGYFSSNRNGSDMIYTAKPVCKAEAIAMVTNSKTGAPLANASVTILDSKGNIIETKQSDAQGKASYGIACKMGYSFQVTAQNFDTASFQIAPVKQGETVIKAPLVPAEVIITETEVILNSIYFEFNKSNITEQGAIELDKLVRVMNAHPTFEIFVKSHTDSKGKAAYNLNLSEKRAQSTVAYLISKGIAKERLSGKGFGSTEPKIKCGTNCTDEENAQNRRSEFLIVKK